MKGGVNRSQKSSICVDFHHQWQFLFNEDLILHHKRQNTKFMFGLFIYPCISVHCVLPSFCRQLQWITDEIRKGHCHEKGEKNWYDESVSNMEHGPSPWTMLKLFYWRSIISHLLLWNWVFNNEAARNT